MFLPLDEIRSASPLMLESLLWLMEHGDELTQQDN